MTTNESNSITEQKRNGRKAVLVLLIMAGAFAAPYLAVYSFMNTDGLLSSFSKSNNGDLISPPVPFGDDRYELSDASSFTISDHKGEWTLLTIGSSACIDQCRDNVISMRQIRRALGVDRRYVQRLFLSADGEPFSATVEGEEDYFTGMKNIIGPSQPLSTLFAKLNVEQGPVEDAIYLIDFKGNVMMYYRPGTAPKAILQDLERLLEVFKPK